MKTLMVTYTLPKRQSPAATDAAVTRIVAEHRGSLPDLKASALSTTAATSSSPCQSSA